MKTIISTLSLVMAMTFGYAQSGNHTIQSNNSNVKWHAEKVTGSHEGNVNIKKGNLVFEKGKLTGGNIEIDMKSITVSDVENEEYNAKLVSHLKSEDFFSVEKNPIASLKFINVKDKGNGNYLITSNLTIKGVTQKIDFTANIKNGSDGISSTADLTIDRTKYDIRYGSGSFFDDLGDKTISDNFDLKINIVATKEVKS